MIPREYEHSAANSKFCHSVQNDNVGTNNNIKQFTAKMHHFNEYAISVLVVASNKKVTINSFPWQDFFPKSAKLLVDSLKFY